MTTQALVLGCVIALLAAAVLNTLIRACADVRIAAHTGVDPRVDRAAAKAAEARKASPGPGTVDRIEQRGHPSGGLTS